MPERRKRKLQVFSTPPPVVAPPERGHRDPIETPQRSAVLAVLYYAHIQDQYCPMLKVAQTFGLSEAEVSQIVHSKRARRLHNSDEPDTRGRPRQLTNSDANAIASYIDQCEFEEKCLPWPELAHRAGVNPPEGKKNYCRQTILKHVQVVSGIETHKAAVKEDHPPKRREERVIWCELQLELRSHGVHWRRVIWYDEIYWSTAPRYSKKY